jgi:restriction endonuclease S subunit
MKTRRKLPEGWQLTTLRRVVREAQTGFACGERDPGGVIQLRMNNVDTRGNLVLDEFIRVPASQDKIAEYRLVPGDVLFNNTNSVALVGKSTLFQGYGEPVVFSNHFTRLRVVRERLDPNFLLLWLVRQWQTKLFENICNRWIGQSAVKSNKLLALKMPLPSLEEQKRIVAVLNEKMSAIERARAAAEAQLEAAQALPAAYLREAFESAEAEKWPQKRLGDVLRQRREVVHPRDNPSGPATFVGLEHIESGTGVRIGADDIEMARLTGRKPRFHKNDIVYGYLRPYLNKVWVAEFGGLCSVDQYVYSVETDIADVEFVAWFMRSSTYMKRAPIGVTPGQLPRIRTDEVAGVKINLPPLAEQRRIVQKLDRQMASSRQVYDLVTDQLATLDGLSPAYLRQAFTGEI